MKVEFALPVMFLLPEGDGFDFVSWWNEAEFLKRLVFVLLFLAASWMVGYTIRTFLGR